MPTDKEGRRIGPPTDEDVETELRSFVIDLLTGKASLLISPLAPEKVGDDYLGGYSVAIKRNA